MEAEDKKVLIEDALRDYTYGFGFRLVWEIGSCWADVKAYEIVSYDDDENVYFHKKDATVFPDDVDDIKDADLYLRGHVKWDGCSELEQEQYYHWCGVRDYKVHIALLQYIYNRAMELMEDSNTEIGGKWSNYPDYVYDNRVGEDKWTKK